MRDDIKTLTEVQEAQERDMAAVHVGKDVVSDGKQSGFCRMTGAEAMLRWREEMMVGHVGRQLALYHTFDDLGHDRNDRNRAVIRDDSWIAGFKNWMYQRVLPSIGKFA